MNLIEQLEKLPVFSIDGLGDVVNASELRAIIEQAKREAVEPVAVPAGYKLVPIEPTDDMKRAYTDKYGFPSYGAGHEYRFMVKEAPESPQQAEIERLKGQRDRLTERLKESQSAVKLCLDTFMYTENVRMADKYHQMWTINSGLIEEIEAEK